jgi:ribose/xylose/arabinose/galactoside ABC-type transport system permease subunit
MLQTVAGTAALGMTMIIISGGIDLSVGSNVALCTVVIALMLSNGVPPLFAAIGGILCGSLCGLMIGLLITRLSLTPFIVTLGMWGAL